MKQNLQLRISQNLALTPQLQQSIRLLQLSSLELDQELEVILQENPLLELVDGDNPDADIDDSNTQTSQTNTTDVDPVGADGESSADMQDLDSDRNIDFQEINGSITDNSSERLDFILKNLIATERIILKEGIIYNKENK